MGIAQRLGDAASLVEERLAALLGTYGPSDGTRLGAAMRHALLTGGKRFRPFLVLESAAVFGIPATQAVNAAAAIECIHCYSLVHDDLPSMDDDDVRRGRPTVHKEYDEWTAILAGDALLTMAFEVLAAPDTHPNACVRAELVAEIAKAAGARGMVKGQMLDLAAGKRGEPAKPTAAYVRELQGLKTGALIACACTAGAILTQAPPRERAASTRVSALAPKGASASMAFCSVSARSARALAIPKRPMSVAFPAVLSLPVALPTVVSSPSASRRSSAI